MEPLAAPLSTHLHGKWRSHVTKRPAGGRGGLQATAAAAGGGRHTPRTAREPPVASAASGYPGPRQWPVEAGGRLQPCRSPRRRAEPSTRIRRRPTAEGPERLRRGVGAGLRDAGVGRATAPAAQCWVDGVWRLRCIGWKRKKTLRVALGRRNHKARRPMRPTLAQSPLIS